ncbi:MAG: winged helix-turn-helix transcriptional regulator [Archaeoglobus sp.]|uniref:winged helix-turn-helix transcriptional regulator n=1 Tax=Archaeoglobus sp. TaxID=1872626 RepID=UPI001D331E91|nr:winged helix-turn-helix transcriptional regulator [Archaeoglobus sp.]MBO8180846.1 winged helix-turn-helix transcriptional regulator [Archaeoglobus sp.]MBO8181065.1 winged helix-turn-helix transcriptional regulator [Archaeoglobus sp.]
MHLKPSHRKILSLLLKEGGKITRAALCDATGYPRKSLRARISELRKMGLVDRDNTYVWLIDEEKARTVLSDENIRADTEAIYLSDVFLDGDIVAPYTFANSATATIVISDLHFGDENVMLETYKSTVNNLILKLNEVNDEVRIEQITVVLNGDTVAGRGIFRGQEAKNIFNKGNIQVLYAAAHLLDLHNELSQIAPVQYFVIKGNHDNHKGDNYAWELADKLRSFGLDAYYAGHQLVMNLGDEEKQHWALIEHGYGGSDYYPVSYDFLRNTWKKLNWLNRRQRELGRKEIERVIVGHSHWLVTNIRQDTYWAIDVSGGFQRNERVELGKNQRPAGFILYVFDRNRDGLTIYDWKGGLRLYEIVPDEEVMLKELFDPALELKNRMDAPRKLIKLYNYLVEKGLIKKEVMGCSHPGE